MNLFTTRQWLSCISPSFMFEAGQPLAKPKRLIQIPIKLRAVRQLKIQPDSRGHLILRKGMSGVCITMQMGKWCAQKHSHQYKINIDHFEHCTLYRNMETYHQVGLSRIQRHMGQKHAVLLSLSLYPGTQHPA